MLLTSPPLVQMAFLAVETEIILVSRAISIDLLFTVTLHSKLAGLPV